jgi:putative transcriptional regulator
MAADAAAASNKLWRFRRALMSFRDPPPLRIEKGLFIVASTAVDSPLFQRGVILLCEHSPHGSFGLLVNKPIEVELPEELLDLEHSRNPEIGLRAGGPVSPEQLMVLHTGAHPSGHSLPLLPDVVLGGDLAFLQEMLQHPGQPPLLLCFGFCSWGPGQLDRELLDGEWVLASGSAADLFITPPEQLWPTMLRRLGGRQALYSSLPDDLSLN